MWGIVSYCWPTTLTNFWKWLSRLKQAMLRQHSHLHRKGAADLVAIDTLSLVMDTKQHPNPIHCMSTLAADDIPIGPQWL